MVDWRTVSPSSLPSSPTPSPRQPGCAILPLSCYFSCQLLTSSSKTAEAFEEALRALWPLLGTPPHTRALLSLPPPVSGSQAENCRGI